MKSVTNIYYQFSVRANNLINIHYKNRSGSYSGAVYIQSPECTSNKHNSLFLLFLGVTGSGRAYIIPLMVALVIAAFITILVAVVVVLLKRRRADKVKEGESVTTRLINTCQIYSLQYSVRQIQDLKMGRGVGVTI